MGLPEWPPRLRDIMVKDLDLAALWNWWQDFRSWVSTWMWSNGSMRLQSMADSAANNNSIYYSTTAGKAVYKDSAGVVHTLY